MHSSLVKARLALQLAFILQRLYPGPWIQEYWNPHVVRLLHNCSDDDQKTSGEVGIFCKFSHDWKSENPIWAEFADVVRGLSEQTNSTFFLSFAQLLVDISEGSVGKYEPSATESWNEALMDKADEIKRNTLLRSYGEAVKGCIDFALDHELRTVIEDRRNRAQDIISTNIVKNLQTNLQLWEAQDIQRFNTTESPSHNRYSRFNDVPIVHRRQVSLEKKTSQMPESVWQSNNFASQPLKASAKRSFFTLFADADKHSKER